MWCHLAESHGARSVSVSGIRGSSWRCSFWSERIALQEGTVRRVSQHRANSRYPDPETPIPTMIIGDPACSPRLSHQASEPRTIVLLHIFGTRSVSGPALRLRLAQTLIGQGPERRRGRHRRLRRDACLYRPMPRQLTPPRVPDPAPLAVGRACLCRSARSTIDA